MLTRGHRGLDDGYEVTRATGFTKPGGRREDAGDESGGGGLSVPI